MDEQQAVTPVRTRRRPSRAGRGHRAVLRSLDLAGATGGSSDCSSLSGSFSAHGAGGFGDSSSHPASYGAVYPAYDGSH